MTDMTLPELMKRIEALEDVFADGRWKTAGARELAEEWTWREREARKALVAAPRATGQAVTAPAQLRDLFELLAYGAECVAGYPYADAQSWPEWIREAGEEAAAAAAWVAPRRAEMIADFGRVLAR